MKPSANSLFIILTALIVAAGAYWYFIMQNGQPEPTVAVGTTQTPAQVEFQSLVTELEPITIDAQIFSDPRFLALRDITTNIVQEQVGRNDPFAPVPGITAQ